MASRRKSSACSFTADCWKMVQRAGSRPTASQSSTISIVDSSRPTGSSQLVVRACQSATKKKHSCSCCKRTQFLSAPCQLPRCRRPVGRAPLTMTCRAATAALPCHLLRQRLIPGEDRLHESLQDVGVHHQEQDDDETEALELRERLDAPGRQDGGEDAAPVERGNGQEVEHGEDAVDDH